MWTLPLFCLACLVGNRSGLCLDGQTARAAADGKDGRVAHDAPTVASKDLPRVHGLEVSEIASCCGAIIVNQFNIPH